jgi:hypothetical protein
MQWTKRWAHLLRQNRTRALGGMLRAAVDRHGNDNAVTIAPAVAA